MLVLDASVTLAWIFARDDPSERDCADRVSLLLTGGAVQVPSLWHTEVANVLLRAERRKLITSAQTQEYLQRLDQLAIVSDRSDPLFRRGQVISLARKHALSAYDACYLELALRIDAVLATFDTRLANAMRNAGGVVFE